MTVLQLQVTEEPPPGLVNDFGGGLGHYLVPGGVDAVYKFY